MMKQVSQKLMMRSFLSSCSALASIRGACHCIYWFMMNRSIFHHGFPELVSLFDVIMISMYFPFWGLQWYVPSACQARVEILGDRLGGLGSFETIACSMCGAHG